MWVWLTHEARTACGLARKLSVSSSAHLLEPVADARAGSSALRLWRTGYYERAKLPYAHAVLKASPSRTSRHASLAAADTAFRRPYWLPVRPLCCSLVSHLGL